MSLTDLSNIKFEHVGNINQPCSYCKKTISNPKFIKRFHVDEEESEFIPKPICFDCSERLTYPETIQDFETEYRRALNEIAYPYIIPRDDLELTTVHNDIINLVKNKKVFNHYKPFLYIHGVPGSGKTVIAKALCRVLKYRFIKAYDIYHSHRNNIGFLYSGSMCIDDMGKEIEGQNRKHLTYEIMDNRYDNKAFTVITTQLDPSLLTDTYGQDFADRIKQYSHRIAMPSKTNWRKN